MFETKTRLRRQLITGFALACLLCVGMLVMTSSNSKLTVATAQNKSLTKDQVDFPHHHKVVDPSGQQTHVSSPNVQLFANIKYYILVSFVGGSPSGSVPRHVALYKWTGGSDCFNNECWSLIKKFSDAEQKNPAEFKLEFSDDVKLLIASWPMGVFENRSCEITPTTKGEGLKFTFTPETYNVVRIAKTPLSLR